MKGKVIVFDGPDGVGKSTQLELTAAWLKEQGHNVHTARASGGTPIGEELRKVSLSDTPRPAETDVYISLAMHTALGQDMHQRVSKGQICLVDRSPAAIIAYNAYGSELADKQLAVDAFHKMMRLWDIDLFLMIDANQSIIDDRRAKRTDKPNDYFEKQGKDYHQRVRQGYEVAAKLVTDSHVNLVQIDGAPSEDKVQKQIRQIIEKVLY